VPPLVPSAASERLALSRAQLAGWLDHDRETRSAAPSFGLTALASLPWFSRWRNHPLAALALGAAVRAWQRKAPDGAAPALQALVLGAAVSVLRRHPKTVLASVALVAVTFFWARRRQRGRPSPPPT
jgi:hypothetical protein